MRLVISLLFLVCVCVTIKGQQSDLQNGKYVVIPSDQGLLANAYQPDCPLQFENAKLLRQVGGPWIQSFSLRNRGAKPIRAFTIGTSTGSEWSWEAIDASHYIAPGQLAPDPENRKAEIVPLTAELRDHLNLRGPMKGVVVLMVARVQYADGAVFDAEHAFKAMKEYFLEVDLRMSKRLRE